MRQKQDDRGAVEKAVREIKRRTRRRFSPEDKIRIVLQGLRGEDSIAELCRREGLHQNQYYRWSKEFLEAGRKRLAGDIDREATSGEVKTLREQAVQLKEALAEAMLENRLLKKKRDWGWGGTYMRYPASEKLEIICTVEQSALGVRRTLQQVGIPRSTFYNWYDRYVSEGFDGLEDKKPDPGPVWNKVPEEITQQLVTLALAEPDLSSRELAVRFTEERRYYLSESTVYRVLKSHDLITAPAFIVLKAAERFANPTTAVNQLWQTDFTYLKVIGWGWFYLSTVLDDFSRYIIAWRLCKTMSASDVSATLRDALQATGLDRGGARHRPRLLSDNGPCYVSSELQSWLAENSVPHTRAKPYHPMTQGKIERWHRTLKDRILLNNYYLPEELERQIDAFVNHYNTNRYHESLNNLTPYDVFTGQGSAILQKRDRIKEKTMILRKRLHFKRRAA